MGRLLRRVTILLMLAAPAGAAQSYIYVAVAAPPCPGGVSCPTGQLLVFDAVTRQLVTSAPLGTAVNVPVGMALSPDGRRLYISMSLGDGTASLVVFDTSRHQMGPTYALAPATAGPVAVTGDSQRVFIGGRRLIVWDVQTASVTSSQDATYFFLFGHPTLDRILAGLTGGFFGPFLSIYALDATNGAMLASENAGFGNSLTMSADGSRLYATLTATSIDPSSGGHVYIYDPSTLQKTGSVDACNAGACFPSMTVDAPGRDRVYVLDTGKLYAFNRTTGAGLAALAMPAPGSARNVVISGDEQRAWVASAKKQFPATPSGIDALTVVDLNTFSAAGDISLSTSPLLLAATPPGATRCTYAVNTRQSSWARDGGTAGITLSTGCAWIASTTASWLHLPSDAASGTGTRTIDLTVDPFFGGDAARSASLIIGGQVVTFTQAGFGSQGPFGSFDTPTDGAAGITGSLPVTGWALDDVGVTRVRVFRDATAGEPAGQVYLGDATFVDGARPDVQAAFPSLPFASRAGWGYLLLTNMLPAGGTGSYRLSAYADDIEGRTTLVGTRTITCANSTATLPFGAIDTPGQGEVVSGTITNWGWALTPQPASIPTDGSAIDVVIDGVVAGHPTFGFDRSDIAGLFPGYANTHSAVGYFTIDTTTMTNGVHTIAWVVRDSLGRAQGIGSRYFTVQNP